MTNHLKRVNKFVLFYFLLVWNKIHLTRADDHSGESSGLSNDFGEALGTVSIVFLSIGAVYVLIRRISILSKMYLTKKEHLIYQEYIKIGYQKSRRILLDIHYWVMIFATIAAVIHGIILTRDSDLLVGIFGWIAASAMIILSISGIIIWVKWKPVWQYRESRSQLRFIHKQWLFSGVMIIGVLFHFAFE